MLSIGTPPGHLSSMADRTRQRAKKWIFANHSIHHNHLV